MPFLQRFLLPVLSSSRRKSDAKSRNRSRQQFSDQSLQTSNAGHVENEQQTLQLNHDEAHRYDQDQQPRAQEQDRQPPEQVLQSSDSMTLSVPSSSERSRYCLYFTSSKRCSRQSSYPPLRRIDSASASGSTTSNRRRSRSLSSNGRRRSNSSSSIAGLFGEKNNASSIATGRPVQVDLSNHQLGPDGMMSLLRAFKTSTQCITVLRLPLNRLGDEGCKILAKAIQSCPSLEFLTGLDVSMNRISDVGVIALADAFRDSKPVFHCDVRTGSSPTISKIALDLSSNQIGPAGALSLAHVLLVSPTRFSGLNFHCNRICDDGVIAIVNALIRQLDTCRSPSSTAGQDHHRPQTSPTSVVFKNTESALTTLNLSSTRIRFESARSLARLLKHPNCIALTTLNLATNYIGPAGAVTLADALVHNKSLKTLNLKCNGIGDVGATAIARALKHDNNTLTGLDVSYNHVSDEGALALANDTLKYNTTLTYLNLYHNPISTGTGLEAILYVLAQYNDTLLCIDLSYSQQSEQIWEQICNIINANNRYISSENNSNINSTSSNRTSLNASHYDGRNYQNKNCSFCKRIAPKKAERQRKQISQWLSSVWLHAT